jgi:predicted outer membrane repeat protein
VLQAGIRMFHFPSWLGFRTRSRRTRASSPRRAPKTRLRLEAFEDRLLPAAPTFTVSNLLDSGTGSLRSAIGQANLAGQGIIDFAKGLSGTIALQSQIDISSVLRVDASVATGNTGPHKIAIDAAKAGGRIFELAKGSVPAGVHVTLIGDPNGTRAVPTGLILEGGNNVGLGGAILAKSAQATIDCVGCDFVNNSATDSGGAIYVLGSVGLYSTTIESNTAATAGGGVWVGNGFGAYNSFITDNKVSNGAGGGVFEAGTGSSILFSHSVVKSNSAVGFSGGGVWTRFNLTSNGSTFAQNTATQFGGAIFSLDGNVTLTTFSGLSVIPTVVTSNSAGRDGGGVWADHDVSLVGSNVVGNTAISNGGGVFATGDVSLDSSKVVHNQALGHFGTDPMKTGFGGGLYASGTVFITNGSQVGGASAGAIAQGNTSLHDGGGIWAQNVAIAASEVDANSTTTGDGGGFWVSLDAHLNNAHVDGNAAPNGNGGGIAYNGGDVFITSSTASATSVPPTSGSSISGNQAINGGGIWNQGGSLIIDSQTLIDNNSASGDGGGIWLGGVGKSLRLDTSTVSHNQAVHGGGIAANGADSVTLFQTRVLFNTATAPGTDLAAGAGLFAMNVPDLSITYSTVASNSATSGNGGGLALIAAGNVTANVAISDSTFGGLKDQKTGKVVPNSAGGLGGAIYVKNVIVDILHVTFNDNVAFGAPTPTTSGKAGSAIYADLGSAVTLEDTLVDDTNNLANPAVNPGSSELLDAAFASGILSAGANLVHDSSWMNVANWNTRNNDISNGNQDLTPLQFNQPTPGRPGPTFTETYALIGGAGEQAIGTGDDVGQAEDQNGRSRPFGFPSDIGAVEFFT